MKLNFYENAIKIYFNTDNKNYLNFPIINFTYLINLIKN
jgi:hypothetical protein